MAQLTTQQVAQLLIGIARAQQAFVEALESQKPGFRSHLAPALQTAARNRNTLHAPTLVDFPSRVLLALQSRTGPDVEQIARELETLLAQPGQGPAAPAVTPADGPSLDMR
jgi:hypothetical protein